MKIFLPFLFLIFISFSCKKSKCDKNSSLTYFTTEYKEKDVQVLKQPSSSINAVWIDFSKNGKEKEYTKYTLCVKSNGNITKETGSCNINWGNQISFMPDSGNSYTGNFIYEKEKFTIAYKMDNRNETLTFIYKKKSK